MKNRILFIAKVLLSGVLLYLIMLKLDWSQLAVSFRRANFFYLFIALVLGVVFNMIKFLKWYNLIKAGNHLHSYWDGAKSYMIGNSLGLITPMRAGDLGRALYFPSKDRPRIMGLTIMDRLIDLVVVLLLSIGGSFVLLSKGFGVLIIFAAFSSLFLIYSVASLHEIFRKIAPDNILGQKINKLIEVLKILKPRTISTALILSMSSFLLCILQFYYLISSFEHISLLSNYLATPLITLSSILPVSFMGLGVREGISILLLLKFGVSAATALSAAFLWFLINNVSISILGLIFLSKVEFKAKKGKTPSMPGGIVEGNVESLD